MIERFFEVAIVDRGGAVELAPVEGSRNGVLLLVLGLEIKQNATGVEVIGGSKLRDRALDEAESLFLSDPVLILEGQDGGCSFRFGRRRSRRTWR